MLKSAGKVSSVSNLGGEKVSLVNVRDVVQFMPQIRYMIERLDEGAELSHAHSSKRQRVSWLSPTLDWGKKLNNLTITKSDEQVNQETNQEKPARRRIPQKRHTLPFLRNRKSLLFSPVLSGSLSLFPRSQLFLFAPLSRPLLHLSLKWKQMIYYSIQCVFFNCCCCCFPWVTDRLGVRERETKRDLK